MLDAVALPPSYEMPGNKQNSVGHRAKAAVVAAREAGLDLPKNAQGFAASAIAKGADSASVFQSLIVSDDPPVSDEVPTEVIDDLVPPDDPAPVPGNVGEEVRVAEAKPALTVDPPIVSDEPPAPDIAVTEALEPVVSTSAEAIALAILQEAEAV